MADDRILEEPMEKEGMPKKGIGAELLDDDAMPSGGGRKICKSIHQYSKGKISSENMDVLMEIGHGCMVTRNYIYQRYGGIKSLGKLYSGYAIDAEVKTAGFREQILSLIHISEPTRR